MNQQCRLTPDAKIQRILAATANAIEEASNKGFDIVEIDVASSCRKLPFMPKHGRLVPDTGDERRCSVPVFLGASLELPGRSSIQKRENPKTHIEAMLDRSGLAWREIEDSRFEIVLEDRRR